MDVSRIQISLDGDRDTFAGQQEIAGEITLGAINVHDVKALELSVLWYTEGKGEEDLAVHYFQRFEATSEQPLPAAPLRFRVKLPESPLSYAGLIVKIQWCVRLRIFPAIGKEVVVDRPFRLGDVPSPSENDLSGPTNPVSPVVGKLA